MVVVLGLARDAAQDAGVNRVLAVVAPVAQNLVGVSVEVVRLARTAPGRTTEQARLLLPEEGGKKNAKR